MEQKQQRWQQQVQNEKYAIEFLQWTEQQVANSTEQQIEDALKLHKQNTMLKKQETLFAPVTIPETIVPLPCLIFVAKKSLAKTPSPKQTDEPVTIKVTNTPKPTAQITSPQRTPQTLISAQPKSTTPKLSTQAASLQPDLELKHVVVSVKETEIKQPPPVNAQVKDQSRDLMSKTPSFVRDLTTQKPELTEPSCRQLVSQLKQMQRRRASHDALLANPHISEDDALDIEASAMRTHAILKKCLSLMWLQKEQIASALQSKKQLASYADATFEPEVFNKLSNDVAQLILMQTILNEGLEPA